MSNRFRPRAAIASLAVAVVALTSACGHDSSIAKSWRNHSVKGRYVYAGEGRTLTLPWRFNASLDLDGRGQYALDVDVRVRGEGDRNTSYGTYSVDDGVLRLADDRGRGEAHELRIRGDSLVAETEIGGAVILHMVGIPKPVFVRQR